MSPLLIIKRAAMPRLLLSISILGILLCLWSMAASVTRPAPFDFLTHEVEQAEASHELSPEAKQKIDARIQELKRWHSDEVQTYVVAHHIALDGLFGLSICSFFLYLYSKRKCA
jgi:hypothetical protein